MMIRLAVLLSALLAAGALRAQNEAVERCLTAAQVLDEIMGTPDRAIPADLMNRAHCVAVAPSVKKAGLIFAGRYGVGVISCRGKGGQGWTGPTTVRIEGGSFGLQIGGSATDVVLLIMNERGKEKLLKSKFTLGGDAAVAGGPVGRSAQAQTDALMAAEILSYSRSRGVFAGVSLEGATLRPDHDANTKIYGRQVTPDQILSGQVPAPEVVKPLLTTLTKYSSAEHK
jgi:lipid-binding SYLF domain-containing protein